MLTVPVLQGELKTAMRLLGTQSVQDLGPIHVSLDPRYPWDTPIMLTTLRRSILAQLSSRFTTAPRVWRSLGCGYRPSYDTGSRRGNRMVEDVPKYISTRPKVGR